VERKVQLICMSWTIKQPEDAAEKRRFDNAMDKAVAQNILIFCAAGDAGAHEDSDYPAAYNPNKVFRIGAAKADGNAWSWAGHLNSLDFIIPGHEVVERESRDIMLQNFKPHTGSSVANALGTGLAALIISCVKLGAIHTHLKGASATSVGINHLGSLQKHAKMKAAFKNIGTSEESHNKFIEVWRRFDETETNFKGRDKDRQLDHIAKLARDLCA
jgi:hypothetical protein